MGQVKEVSVALLDRSKGMAESAGQVSTATNEIAATLQQVSSGAHNQATRTQETAQGDGAAAKRYRADCGRGSGTGAAHAGDERDC